MQDALICRLDQDVVSHEVLHPIGARENYFRYNIALSLAKEITKEIMILTGGYSLNRKWDENVQNLWNDSVEHSFNM